MSVSLTVFVSTKNTDLHAVSAFEALNQIMGYSELKFLNRFRVLYLTFDCNTSEEAKKYLDYMVTNSFDLMNPNKEAYQLSSLHSHVSGLKTTFINVRQKRETGDSYRIVSHFNERHQLPILEFDSSIVWELGFDSNYELNDEDVLDRYVWSSSMTEGLLAHPVQDSVAILDASSVYA